MKKLVSTVKSLLNDIKVDVPFIIAGGAAFSAYHNRNEYNDIDVYFYNEDDYLSVSNSIQAYELKNSRPHDLFFSYDILIGNSNNAVTCKFLNQYIQFIKVVFGNPDEIFETFDINCSKICITSDYEIIKHKSFSKNIDIDFNNFKWSTSSRYLKYVERKGALDNNNNTAYEIINYLIENYENKIEDVYYEDFVDGSIGKLELKNFNNSSNNEYNRYIHDQLVSKFTGDELVDVFINMYESLFLDKCWSDEYIASRVYVEIKESRYYWKHHNELFDSKDIERIKLKFAEYFI